MYMNINTDYNKYNRNREFESKIENRRNLAKSDCKISFEDVMEQVKNKLYNNNGNKERKRY